MHPPLFKPHPKCEDLMKMLVQCHDENPALKFFGACNSFKAEMDACFRAEKEERRKDSVNRGQKKKRDAEFAAFMKDADSTRS
jgi:COX assembly protein 2